MPLLDVTKDFGTLRVVKQSKEGVHLLYEVPIKSQEKLNKWYEEKFHTDHSKLHGINDNDVHVYQVTERYYIEARKHLRLSLVVKAPDREYDTDSCDFEDRMFFHELFGYNNWRYHLLKYYGLENLDPNDQIFKGYSPWFITWGPTVEGELADYRESDLTKEMLLEIYHEAKDDFPYLAQAGENPQDAHLRLSLLKGDGVEKGFLSLELTIGEKTFSTANEFDKAVFDKFLGCEATPLYEWQDGDLEEYLDALKTYLWDYERNYTGNLDSVQL